jgi:cobalt-zinc-cadmium efflux system outer membrane protein
VEILGEWEEFHEELRDRVAKLVELGAVGSVELHRVARATGRARIDLEEARGELTAARHRLAATWGNPVPRFTDASGDLGPVVPIPPIESVLDLAKNGPAVARWTAEADRGEAALALAKAQRVPDLTYGAGIRWEDDIDDRGYLVDVEIAIPIFDHKKGEVREAQFDIARARAGRRAAEATSATEIAEAHSLLAASAARASLLRDEIVPAVRATLDALENAFEDRAVNHDELLDARRDLAESEVDEIDALVEYHEALSTLEGLVGESLTYP